MWQILSFQNISSKRPNFKNHKRFNLQTLTNLIEHSAASSFGRSLRGAWQIKYSSHIFRYWTLKVQQTTAFRNGKKFSLFLSCTYVLTCAYKSPTTAKLHTHSRHFFPKSESFLGLTMGGFICTFWYSLSSTSSILE